MRDTFLRRLAELVEAGLSPARALAAVREGLESRRWRTIAAAACADVVAGRSLADAIARTGCATAIVRAGEAQGRLAESLGSAARLARVEKALAAARLGLALAALVSVGCASMLAAGSVVLVPGIERTFDDLGAELPEITELVLRASALWPLALAAAGAVLFGCLRGSGRLRWASSAIHAGSALGSGVPMTEALALAAAVGPRGRLEWMAAALRQADREGASEWLAGSKRVLETLAHDWATGWAARTAARARWARRGALLFTGTWFVLLGFAVFLPLLSLCDHIG